MKKCDNCEWHEIGWDYPCTECENQSMWEPKGVIATEYPQGMFSKDKDNGKTGV